ncbi:methyl-accepting chemotaxis protein [Oleiphilus messinensis]|nr:methyl-accepting chemotaxis protein [Oleiphilus messinensis]
MPKLKTLARINTTSLIFIALILGYSTYWGLSHLKKPQDLITDYDQLFSRFSLEVEQPLLDYLDSGNALNLQRAETGLEALSTELGEFPEAFQQQLTPSLQQLETFLKGDFRAAGKLSGDPQVLLTQNDREVRDEISSLIDYALEGWSNDEQAARTYVKLANELVTNLVDRSLLRESYFADQNSKTKTALFDNVSAALAIYQEIEALPFLGIYLEADNEFMLGEPEEEDKAETIVANLGSALRRYEKDFTNTEGSIKQSWGSQIQIRSLIVDLRNELSEAKSSISAMFDDAFTLVRASNIGIVLVIALVAFIIDTIQRGVIQRIKSLQPFLREYAEGDFSREVDILAKTEETKSLKDSANHLRLQLVSLVSDIGGHSSAVGVSSKTIADVAREVNSKTVQQLHETNNINRAIEDMTESFAQMAQSASEASDAAQSADTAVKRGDELLEAGLSNVGELVNSVFRTESQLNSLSEEARSIDAVLTVIVNIAEQTNLLALNAAIEAARAGEQGRGFAVVAEEVRGLSQRTSDSTKEIKEIIDRLQHSTEDAVDSIRSQVELAKNTQHSTTEAGQALKQIVAAMEKMSAMNIQIAQTTEEQAQVARLISDNVGAVNRLADESVQCVERAELESGNLVRCSELLNSAVGRFKVEPSADGFGATASNGSSERNVVRMGADRMSAA